MTLTIDEFGRCWDSDSPAFQNSLALVPEANRRGLPLKLDTLTKAVPAVTRLRAPLRSIYYRAKKLARTQTDGLKMENAELRADGGNLCVKMEGLRSVNDELRKEIEMLRGQVAGLKEGSEGQREENRKLGGVVGTLKEENEDLWKDVQALTARNEELEARVHWLQEVVQRRNADLQLAKRQL
ncbi:hypothetical protein DENSPDRAFT_898577 [Dentipellis sp. KUC8613]|nr:hypothetical protein DENSPDRAFT_898577 [Dentipellis sp. KUC8613]